MSMSDSLPRHEEAAAAEPPARGPFRYGIDLAFRLAGAEQKTARTRLRLMIALAGALEEGDLHTLRVADCVARAGLAHGTFYRYWPDAGAAAHAVLADFMATVTARRPQGASHAGLHARIVAANRYYVRVYRLNSGLMRCLMQLGNADPAFARIGQEANVALAARVVRGWEREDPAGTARLGAREKTARALACIAMVEGVLRDRHVRRPLEPLASMSDDTVADLLSDAWYTVLLGHPPGTTPATPPGGVGPRRQRPGTRRRSSVSQASSKG